MIQTPCIKVCVLDPRSKLCTGCGRSLDEIARWGSMSDTQRAAIMGELPSRLQKAGIAPVTVQGSGPRSA